METQEINTNKVFTLLEVCRSIQNTLNQRYGSSFWVKAEMHKLNFYSGSGHCFPELLQKENDTVVAEMRATLWKIDYERIQSVFLKEVKEPLKEGIEILFLACIQYDPKYGLSLRIIDIDVSFVLGKLERERAYCRERLKKEGLWDLNKACVFPLLPKRIAIISSSNSKGYSDFVRVLGQNPQGYQWVIKLFPALLQGDNAAFSIISALHKIYRLKSYFDIVIIIRGGGGEIGLNCYNSYDLAKAVAQFPLPILTGIGHSTNLTITEEVAFYHGITPTDSAMFVLSAFEAFEAALMRASSILSIKATERLKEERAMLLSMQSRLKNILFLVASQRELLAKMQRNLLLFTSIKINFAKQSLMQVEKVTQIMNPKRMLKLGYSLTYFKGHLIKDAKELKKGDTISTLLGQGVLDSVVQNNRDGSDLNTENNFCSNSANSTNSTKEV
ncbi:MAG: exodeoxyribonuclease VII large subunit [Bacteroidales bacterium]